MKYIDLKNVTSIYPAEDSNMNGLPENWQLPEGIEESLPDEALRLEGLRRKLLDMYLSWGYEFVMPPMIEYLDSLLVESPALDLQTFKITDQLSGRLMGIRADMTPQIARIDAHCLKSKGPARFSYMGTVLKTRPDSFAGSRGPLQFGVELYGYEGVEGDLEVINLMLDSMEICGIDSLHLDLGHVGIFKEISRLAGLETDQEEALFDMLQRKSIPEIRLFLDSLDLDADVKSALIALPRLTGGQSIFAEAETLKVFQTGLVSEYLQDLSLLGNKLQEKYPQLEVNYDFAELCGYRYKTGIAYALYTPGEGRELARGGRYNGIGAAFGNARPATGFSADLKNLLRLSKVEVKSSVRKIFANDQVSENCISKLRNQGEIVVQALGAAQNPQDYGCTHQINKLNNQWKVEKI